ncbi:hypothetical protein ACFE04_000768 [Oxalis oulophora]
MEDSNTMTVEFLRARLLAERSVSRTARQRSEELAKRVYVSSSLIFKLLGVFVAVEELEEHLMIVSLQRKKAEKATADVLAILENNGISDFSEAYYSSSDQEGNGFAKEEDSSVSSKVRKNESEEFSGSDLDFSSVNGRSLSWKGRMGNSHSLEKYKDAIVKRRNNFSSIGYSSPKHRQGKSCRQIRRRESRSAIDECKTDSMKVKSQHNETATLENFPGRSGGDHEKQNGCCEIQEVRNSQENRNLSHRDLNYNGYEREQAMEKALEQQAKLIGRYEAMEKTQREWEEKFRENNGTTPDSCDPENHSDITEERDDIKSRALHLTETRVTSSNKSKPVVENTEFSQHQKSKSKVDLVFTMQKQDSLSYLQAKEKAQKQNILENNTQKQDSLSKGQCSGTHTENHAVVLHKTNYDLGGVLESLKQAKLSLQQKIHIVPQIESRLARKINGPHDKPSSVPLMNAQPRAEIPVGCAGLFRLPTDFSPVVDKSSLFEQSSQLILPDYHPDMDPYVSSPYRDMVSTNCQIFAGDRFFNSPLTETRSSIFSNDRNVMSPYLDDRSGISNQTLPYPSREVNMLSPPIGYIAPTFSDPSRVPPNEGFSAPHSNGGVARTPSPDHFSFYDNHGIASFLMAFLSLTGNEAS